MIFVAIALLVAAAIGLGIGIASSSVAPLVVSVLCTLAAGGTLWASFIHYRKAAADEGLPVTGLGGNQPLAPGYPDAYGGAAPTVGAVSHAAAPVPAGPVPAGWDQLPDADAQDAVDAFNLDELHVLRRHEVEHAHRSAVLVAIDGRIDHLVSLRRKLSTSS